MNKFFLSIISENDGTGFDFECQDQIAFEFMKWGLLSPFMLSFDDKTGAMQLEEFQQNKEELRKKLQDVTDKIKTHLPKYEEFKCFFEEKIGKDEWFLLNIDRELTNEDITEIRIALAKLNHPEQKDFYDFVEYTFNQIKGVYELIAYDPEKPLDFGEKKDEGKVCRYCKEKYPEVTFEKVAHTISEAFGNKAFITNDECDACNERFGNTLEPDLLSIFDYERVEHHIKGKGNKEKSKLPGRNYMVEAEPSGPPTLTIYNKGNDTIEIDDNGVITSIKMKMARPPFPAQNLYRCLVKYAMGILGSGTLNSLENTRLWLRGEKTVDKLPMVAVHFNAFVRYKPELAVYIRKEEASPEFPHVLAELKLINRVFVFIIPLSEKDSVDFTNENNFKKVWDFLNIYNKVQGWHFWDLSSNESKMQAIKIKIDIPEIITEGSGKFISDEKLDELEKKLNVNRVGTIQIKSVESKE